MFSQVGGHESGGYRGEVYILVSDMPGYRPPLYPGKTARKGLADGWRARGCSCERREGEAEAEDHRGQGDQQGHDDLIDPQPVERLSLPSVLRWIEQGPRRRGGPLRHVSLGVAPSPFCGSLQEVQTDGDFCDTEQAHRCAEDGAEVRPRRSVSKRRNHQEQCVP